MIFLSHVIDDEMPLYGNEGYLSLNRIKEIKSGDSSNNTDISRPAHSGTHIDAPYHFEQNGFCIEEYPAEFWLCEHIYLININAQEEEIISLEKLMTRCLKVYNMMDNFMKIFKLI